MNDKNEGLNERLAHRKRIQRMKTGLILFIVTWMLAWMLISVALIAKVNSLQDQIDIITKNTIRSQQVEQQENQVEKSGSISQADGKEKSEEEKSGEEKSEEEKSGETKSDQVKSEGTGRDSLGYVRMSADHVDKKDEAGSAGAQTAHTDEKAQKADVKDVDEENLKNEADHADNTKENEAVKKVYLTFDDGPSKNTEQILDILDQYQIKATFFVTGRQDKESIERYRMIAQSGHTIGMHSYSHKYDEIYHSTEAFEQDLDQIQKLLKDKAGIKCMLYRFPGGSSNQVSSMDMTEFIRILNQRGITYFDWNVECGDASYVQYSAKEMVANVMKDVVKYHTSVVLMHDAENKQNTIKALPKIIKQLQKMDAQLLPIDENTQVVQHVSAESVKD